MPSIYASFTSFFASHSRSLVQNTLLAAALLFSATALGACGEDAPDTGEEADTVIDTTIACACDDGCPDGLCDVRVVLESDCVGKLDEAEVLLSGIVAGVVTPSAPFASCEAYPCDTVLELEVRGGGFSTGTKSISVLLDPDIPYSCINMP